MTYWRLTNKWCKKCQWNPGATEARNIQEELRLLKKDYAELLYRYKEAIEKIDELAERLRRADS